jgi:phosphoglycolate phosphatase
MKFIEPFILSKKHVIWDWNGTLVDDVDLCVSLLADELRQRQLNQVSKEKHREQFCFPIHDYYKKIGFKYTEEEFKTASIQFSRDHNKALKDCRLFEGTVEFILSLRRRGIKQSVLSATHEPLLFRQLEEFNILHLFDWVYGLSDHYATSKIHRGQHLIAQSGLDASETLLIGDTDHDLAVGKTLGIEVLLIADGHQSYERLKEIHPHVVRSRADSLTQ